jgi:hypothetical protein
MKTKNKKESVKPKHFASIDEALEAITNHIVIERYRIDPYANDCDDLANDSKFRDIIRKIWTDAYLQGHNDGHNSTIEF